MKTSGDRPKSNDKVQYICPMRCEPDKIYTSPGKCPFCDMNLVRACNEAKNIIVKLKMYNMKTLVFIFSIMTFLTLNSFGQDKKIAGLLENQANRTEIFNAILSDHNLMMEFMQAMKGNEDAMMMMKGNNPMMEKDGKMEMTPEQLDSQHEHQMMGHGDMIGMMKENPKMMRTMMGTMMDMCKQDSSMCSNMADMMTEHPEMMEMCMKKMKEKGMMGPDGKMKMMNSKGKSTEKEHKHQH